MFFMIDILVMGFLKYRIGVNPVLMIIQNFKNTLMGNRWMSLYFDNFSVVISRVILFLL